MSVTLRPAVADDFRDLVGKDPPFRVQAITGELDGKPIGIGGIAHQPDGITTAFLTFRGDARKVSVSLHRAALLTLESARKLGIRRIVAKADPDIERAEPWLLRLGFEPLEYDGERFFVWNS